MNGQLLLALSLVRAETIHDTELGMRLEIPVSSSPGVVETGLGHGEGGPQLHFGWEATFSYAITEAWFFTGLVGARRAWVEFEEVDQSMPFLITRSQRLMLGTKRSLSSAPTFPYVSVHAGLVGSWWRVEVFGLEGDRVAYGPAVNVGLGVDHFLNPRVAANLELRPWFERSAPERIAVSPWVFESPPHRYGFSVLAGVIYR